VTTFVCVFAALLNNPFGPIARALTAQVLAMMLLALFIVTTIDYSRLKRTKIRMRPIDWLPPAAFFILFLWSACQWIVALVFADQK
jgi:hypothetical protein